MLRDRPPPREPWYPRPLDLAFRDKQFRRFQFMIEHGMYVALQRLAREDRISMGALLRRVIAQHLRTTMPLPNEPVDLLVGAFAFDADPAPGARR